MIIIVVLFINIVIAMVVTFLSSQLIVTIVMINFVRVV